MRAKRREAVARPPTPTNRIVQPEGLRGNPLTFLCRDRPSATPYHTSPVLPGAIIISMVLPAFFSKSSPKKKPDSDSKSNQKAPDLSPRSPTRKSSSRSPTKSTRERQPRSVRKTPRTQNSSRQIFAADTHPLNLPPDERERRRSAMEAPGEALPVMEVEDDSRAPSVPSSPPPMSPGIIPDMKGGRDEDRNGDSSPAPPPHGINTTSSPPPAPKWAFPPPPSLFQPQQPTIDPEACKTLGNKYFIAKDYKRAIKEYTRGECLCLP